MELSVGLACILLILSVLAVYRAVTATSRPPLPPGPPADPIIGHLRILPADNQHIVFHEWSTQYGSVIHLHCLGRSIVILNDLMSAVELLEKRSTKYSDRPKFTYYELLGWNASITFMQYGSRLRKHRRLFHEAFNPEACESYQAMQRDLARDLVQKLMSRPEEFDTILNWYSVAIVMRITYGRRVLSNDDEYVKLARDAAGLFADTGPPGGNAIDLFPYLQHFPTWFPGTYYAKYARKWRHIVQKLHDYPYDDVKQQLAAGTAEPSYLASQLEQTAGMKLSDEDVEDIKTTAVAIYAAGHETTWATILWFVLAMVLYPEFQKKAQDEVDAVVGRDRLPEFADQASLPYVECLIQEVLRWQPAVPLGVPHLATEDDIYEGMFIAKGTLVFANATGIALDENVYHDATQFNPSRFLPKPNGYGEPYPQASFGFGRRICPATLNIERKLDENNREIIPDIGYKTGITSHPNPFVCNIVPRSDNLVHKQH